MNLITSLSFTTCYYIRKILLQNFKDLQWTLNQNNGFCINSSEDLKQLFLESVYLEEILGQLLQRLYGEEKEISIKVQQLEALCLAHQKFVGKYLQSEEMLNIQQQIFWLLGFKRIEITIAEIVDALNQLSKYSSSYLGAKITTNNWQSNRPNSDWLNNFSIDTSAKFVFSGTIAEVESFIQLQWVHKWVAAFVLQYTKTFRDFPKTIEQRKLGEVKKGLLLTNVGAYSAWLNVDTKPVAKILFSK